jgi:tetratricopeptide (TPR) repeat protein
MSEWEDFAESVAGVVVDAATDIAMDGAIGAFHDHILNEDSYIGGNKLGAGIGVIGAVGIGALGMGAPIAIPALILGGVLGAGAESGTKSAARGVGSILNNVTHGVRNTIGGIIDFFKSEEDFFLSGLEKLENGYISDAHSDFSKAIELNINYVGGHLGKGLVALNRNNYEEAKKHFLKALTIDSKETLSLYYLACIELELGCHQQSIDFATRGIKICPNDIDYYLIRISSFIELTKFDKALDDCDKVLSIEKDNISVLSTKGQILIEQGEFINAIDIYDDLMNIVEDSDKTEILYTRGCLLFEVENYDAAISDFSSILEILPENCDAYFQRGATYLELESFSKALSDFSKAIQLNCNEPSYYYYQGLTYFELNNFNSAESSFLKVIELSPKSIEGHYFLGCTYLELKQSHKALKNFFHAKEIDSSLPIVDIRIAEAYEIQENYKKAIHILKLLIDSSRCQDSDDLILEVKDKINFLEEKDKLTPWWKKKKYWQPIAITSVILFTIFTGYFLSYQSYKDKEKLPEKVNINTNTTQLKIRKNYQKKLILTQIQLN